ncbi:MAG: hypothetical protein IJY82_04725 [Oscillospiraceae bacterium]|nr:hypothetical protein [Oscillospiraceae bacterium]
MKEKKTHRLPRRPQDRPTEKTVEQIISMPPSRNDPFGSYTGKPMEKYEVPVQDQDDL